VLLIKNPDLLSRFRKGESSALEEVYLFYVKGVSHFLSKGFSFRSGDKYFYFKGCKSPFDLHNAVQEVFRRAFEEKARLSYNGVNTYSNWILAIARNMVINQFRNKEIAFSQFEDPHSQEKRRFENEIKEEYVGLLYGNVLEKPDALAEKLELKEIVKKFMAGISSEDQNLLMYRFVEGLGQEESAKQMGSTRMKVRTQEAKLRKRLFAYLKDTGYIDHYLHLLEPTDMESVSA